MKRLGALALVFVLWLGPLTRSVHAEPESPGARMSVSVTQTISLRSHCLPYGEIGHHPESDDVDTTAKVKSQIAKRVTNKKTRVKVKLRNGRELKGRIERANDNGFTITEEKTGKETELAYSEVQKVSGRGLGKGAKFGIAAAIAVGVLAIIVVIALKNFDPFEGGLGHVPP